MIIKLFILFHYQPPPPRFFTVSTTRCHILQFQRNMLARPLQNFHDLKRVPVTEKCIRYSCSACPSCSPNSVNINLRHSRRHYNTHILIFVFFLPNHMFSNNSRINNLEESLTLSGRKKFCSP